MGDNKRKFEVAVWEMWESLFYVNIEQTGFLNYYVEKNNFLFIKGKIKNYIA